MRGAPLCGQFARAQRKTTETMRTAIDAIIDTALILLLILGSVPAGAARSGGRIVRRSVVHTPRHWETGRPRAAQFAPCPVYILGAVYILGQRDDVVLEGRCAGW